MTCDFKFVVHQLKGIQVLDVSKKNLGYDLLNIIASKNTYCRIWIKPLSSDSDQYQD